MVLKYTLFDEIMYQLSFLADKEDKEKMNQYRLDCINKGIIKPSNNIHLKVN